MVEKMSKADIQRMVIRVASELGINPAIALAIVEQESGFNVGARNSKGEDSYGLMQINRQAHPDYNPNSTPEQNVRYGLTFYKNLLARTNGNVEEALAAYNGGYNGRNIPAAKNYARQVLSRVNKYSPVANNDRQIAQNINNIQTGAAAPVPSSVIDPRVMQIANNIKGDPLSAEGLMEISNSARAIDNELVNKQIEKSKEIASYMDTPMPVQMANGEVAYVTPRQLYNTRQAQVQAELDDARNQYLGIMNPNSTENKQFVDNMYGRLNDAYNKVNEEIAKTYQTGPSVNPETVAILNNIGLTNQSSNASGLSNAQTNPVQNYLNNRRMIYEAQIAAQNGMPYEQFMAMQQAKVNAANAQATAVGSMNERFSQDRAAVLGKYPDMYQQDVERAKAQAELIDAQKEFDMNLIKELGATNAELYKQQMINNGTYMKAVMGYAQALDSAKLQAASGIIQQGISSQTQRDTNQATNAANLERAYIEGNYGLQKQQMSNQGDQQLEQLKQQDPSRVLNAYSNIGTTGAIMGENQFNNFIKMTPTGFQNTVFPNANAVYNATPSNKLNPPVPFTFNLVPNGTLGQ